MESRGDAKNWNVMLDRFKSETNAQEKKKLMLGLASTNKAWILSHWIKLAQNETIVRSQDFFTALRYVISNPIGKTNGLNSFALRNMFGVESQCIYRMCHILCACNFEKIFILSFLWIIIFSTMNLQYELLRFPEESLSYAQLKCGQY